MSNQSAHSLRLAIRTEGLWISAYIAQPNTMIGATLLGSIRRAACESDRALAARFTSLMQDAMRTVITGDVELIGVNPYPPGPPVEGNRDA
ncbi:MAG TPA: hypothetical protein VNK91_02090 [Burkholderiaceae bacterium]|nr:hypothetical protein [Burkholderiaceae bacterium]